MADSEKAKARGEAQRWWNSSQGDRWRSMGGAKCDANSLHRIPPGGGCMGKPRGPGDYTPDLVCERCFDAYGYAAWEAVTPGGRLADAELRLLAQDVRAALFGGSL